MASWTEFKKIVYERVEVKSLRERTKPTTPRSSKALRVLGINIALGRNVFRIADRFILETRLRSVEHEDSESELKMLRGLLATGFEGVFTISYEPFNYEVRFSTASRSIDELNMMFSRLKASILASYPHAEFEQLEASPDIVLWALGGFPVSKKGNALILIRGRSVSAASFLFMKLKENVLPFLKKGLGDALRSSAESGCSLRFHVPVKSCRGFLHAVSLWARRRSLSSQYSKAYMELRENGLFNSRGELIGSDLGKSAKLELLRSQYERLSPQTGCWECSPVIVVIGPPAKSTKQAYAEQKKHVEAVKASFSSSYGVKLEEAGWLSLGESARSLLARKIIGSSRIHATSEELSLFVSLPEPITPSLSYNPKRSVEFEAFNPVELDREGILLGYYKSMGRKLEVRIGIDDLPLHLAVFGIPGSGKTTLVKNLLRNYLKLGGLAMVFDRHGEYVKDFNAVVLDPENTRINLLEHDGNPESHAKILSEVFAIAWPDEFGPLISYVFRRMYLKYARKADTPNLADFLDFLEKSTDSDDWAIIRSGRARDKLFSLLGRLSELLEGNMGKVFDTLEGGEDRFEELLSRSVVFNLVDFDTDRDANIFTWLILKKVYDYRRKRPNNGLPHITVCEEAHNIAPARFEGQETIVEKMLREMRKFWESVWLVDQRPLTVSRDILGLCGTIVCLRLQYSSDVEKVADTMHLNGEQALKLQELEQGEAIVLLPGMKTAIPVMVHTGR